MAITYRFKLYNTVEFLKGTSMNPPHVHILEKLILLVC